MAELPRHRRLRKELSLLGVFAIATGTTLSSGFFLLPGLAAQQVGPALVLSYLLAVIPLLPAMFSIVELATAMPRAGGVYYFLDRTLGPAVGTIGGIGTWLVLLLKVGFALVGIGAYLERFWPEIPLRPLVVGVAIVLSAVNMFGSRKAGGLQASLVFVLLAILGAFVVAGVPSLEPRRFEGFLDAGWHSIVSTAGFVYVSYVGITTVVSLSEEVKDPERTLPRGIFLTLATVMVVYLVGTTIMVGVIPMDELRGDLTPAATAAAHLFGRWGDIFVSAGAIVAFTSVANAGIMSASRFPLAMSRDHLMPRPFRFLWRRIPFLSILLTLGVLLVILIVLDPTRIAKLASAFQLLMFALVCVAVIVMRESRIPSYDPGYRSPLYPWLQIVGVLAPLYFIGQMGWTTILFTVGLGALGLIWFRVYGRERVARDGAIFHVFARWGQLRYEGLDRELRGILKEKGLRKADPFDEIVARSTVVDAGGDDDFPAVVAAASRALAGCVPLPAEELGRQFLEGTLIGATPVTRGVALPHLRVEGLEQPEMVLVRSRTGVRIHLNDPLSRQEEDLRVRAIFFVVSPTEDPARHLRILAQIAGRVDDDGFETEWLNALDEAELREILLREERFLTVFVSREEPIGALIGRTLKDVDMPVGCLVALVRRRGETIVPRGSTALEDGDRLTVIGSIEGVRTFATRYGGLHRPVPPRT